ncbi:MAG: 30S ribosomal protein S5 [Candidatus Marsarchaeota archaeon]|nr:30S ribosomal protein S5 [Candidatus Marsarchaeota archaeon]MCL5413118.1 30S ribosomal protein S5 [Candidatus Marsarchaeota archaeon]
MAFFQEEEPRFNMAEWNPRTKIGQMVKNGEITRVEQIFAAGKPIKEVEIVEALLPGLEDKVLEIASVQRMTKNNRKQKFRATVVIGDKNGHIGIGVGKDVEAKPAIQTGIRNAKQHIISIELGCGSWECNCGTKHSLPLTLKSKCGSGTIILKPAPRGVGIAASATVRTVLDLAGVKDMWTFSKGRTRDKYNMALATYNALKSQNDLKNIGELKA